MPEQNRFAVLRSVTTEHGATVSDAEAPEKEKKKKKGKVRAAWISFVSRIVAQILGAAVAIGLAVMVAGRVSSGDGSSARTPASEDPTRLERVTPPRVADRSAGEAFVVVLPFESFSENPAQQYLADGMTEAIITNLAKTRGLRVISRTSSMRYKGDHKSLPDIARELGVDVVVEGAVACAGDRVRITAQVIDAATDTHLWADSYDRSLRDVLALQAEVATAIVREIGAALARPRTSG